MIVRDGKFTLRDLADYLEAKTTAARNELADSQFYPQKRVQSITIDLSEDRTITPYEINTQFRGIHVARIYSTSEGIGAVKQGYVRLIFDKNTIASKTDFKTLQAFDFLKVKEMGGETLVN
jgi:hypothetical protein